MSRGTPRLVALSLASKRAPADGKVLNGDLCHSFSSFWTILRGTAGDDSGQRAAFAGGFQSFLVPQDIPAGKGLKEFTGAQDEIRIFRTAGKGTGAAEGAQHRESAGAYRLPQVRQKGALQIKEEENHVEAGGRQPGGDFKIDLAGLNRQGAAGRFAVQLVQGLGGAVEGGDGEAPLSEKQGMAPPPASQVEGAARIRQEGRDGKDPGVDG